MQNSRLVKVLDVLSKQERKELGLWLRSPFFNRRKEILDLYDWLIDTIYIADVSPTKEQAYQALSSGAPYDAQKMRQWMSWLLKQVECWLAYREFFDEQIYWKPLLIKSLRKKQLHDLFDYHWEETQEERGKQNNRSDAYYEAGYSLQQERYLFTAAQQRTGEHNLQAWSDQTDLVFALRKLRQACLVGAHQAVNQTQYAIGFLPEVLAFAEKLPEDEHPAIRVYYLGYRMQDPAATEDYFPDFRRLILERRDLFPPEEWRDLLLLAINYCIKKLNQGDSPYAAEGLQLYKVGLEGEWLLNEGLLSRFAYRNIVAMALKVGDLNWTEQFIHQYRRMLPGLHRESMYSFSLARLEYERRRYDQALVLLQKAEYADVLLNLAAKTLQLKIFYDRQAWDWLQAHLDAMHNFIRRKRLLGYHRQNYLGIVRFTRKLLNVNRYDRAKVAKLREALQKEEFLTEKEWMLEKLEAL